MRFVFERVQRHTVWASSEGEAWLLLEQEWGGDWEDWELVDIVSLNNEEGEL